MAVQIVAADSVGAGLRVNLGTTDHVYIGANATVASTDNFAIQGTGNNHYVHVAGDIFGVSNGIVLGNSRLMDSGQQVLVGAGGSVGGFIGISLEANSSQIVNHGSISGAGTGIALGGIGFGQSRVVNFGSITASIDHAITRGILSDERVLIENYGTIAGGGRAYDSAGTGIDTVRNGGTMVGDVVLGGGNDVFDNRGGTIDGTVFGGDGNDIFFAGTNEEVFDGGAGTDTLNVFSSTGGTIDLSGGGAGTGVALGDTYTGIENVSGSLAGVDIVIGSTAVNVIFGFGGTDALNGGAGNDFLTGNAGADTLVGGTGNDFFQYAAPSEGGDNILDFGNVTGNNDVFRISAAGFGGGLLAGALAANQFQSRADNVAQDADDRFIFRTTDQTLWFDVNGNAAGGPVLIADMQTGVVLTAADIIMF